MTCFALFHESKQIKVFAYTPSSFRDRERAKLLAFDFARKALVNGYPYTIEEFGPSGVGCIVFDQSRQIDHSK